MSTEASTKSLQHRGAVKVVAIDGEESPDLVARLGVCGYPTFLGVVCGEVVERRVAFGGKRPLEALFAALRAAPADAAAAP
jgi:hypothetical protein